MPDKILLICQHTKDKLVHKLSSYKISPQAIKLQDKKVHDKSNANAN